MFRGSQDAWAYTADREGANLPAQYRPWRYVGSIPRNDARFRVGRDRDEILELDAKGYSVSFIRLTIQRVP